MNMYKYNDLNEKTVLVTGASGDIGLGICEKYLEQSCDVYALYKSNDVQLTTLKASHPAGDKLHIVQCDLACPPERERIVRTDRARSWQD